MPETLKYYFCDVTIYDNFMVVVIKKGEHITPDHNKVLVDIVNRYFKNKSFVYITHRKNSYSVDPAIYFETSKIENLCGFAVVAEVPVSKGNAEIEKLFLNKPFEIFSNLDEAILWANDVIHNQENGVY